jgi:hypothetical protein
MSLNIRLVTSAATLQILVTLAEDVRTSLNWRPMVVV